jgi:hypothetical protein
MTEPISLIEQSSTTLTPAPRVDAKPGPSPDNVRFLRGIGGSTPDAGLRSIANAGPNTQEKGETPDNYPRVAIGGRMLGMEMTKPGQSFSLGNIFSADAGMLGGDRFTGVVVKTKSGNEYYISGDMLGGQVINGSRSREQGRPYVSEYDGEVLARSNITIGKPLVLGKGTESAGMTSDVVSATFINGGRIYDQEYLAGITEGRTSTALEDFRRFMRGEDSTPPAQEKAAPAAEKVDIEKLQRPLTLDDVKEFQRQIREFERISRSQGRRYMLNQNQYYEFLSTGSFYGVERQVSGAPEVLTEEGRQAYDALLLETFVGWRANLISNQDRVRRARPDLERVFGNFNNIPVPTSAAEVRQLYIKYPALNKLSAAEYQNGLSGEFIESNFLHFDGSRKSGYEYERTPIETRFYLNPPVNEAPNLAREFIRIAEQRGIPYYFKLADFSMRPPSASEYKRIDRMLLYTDRANAQKIADVLTEIKTAHPEWFQGRDLPPMVAKVMDGVGIAVEPNEFQNKKFSSRGETRASFNQVRAAFFDRLWPETMRQILLKNPDLRPRGGRSFREIFNDFVPPESKSVVGELWDRGLKADDDDKAAQIALDYALRYTVQDVIPDIKAESLLPWVQMIAGRIAPDFGIDPNNIAANK